MRDCENCEHYKDSGQGFRACEAWECDKEDVEKTDNSGSEGEK